MDTSEKKQAVTRFFSRLKTAASHALLLDYDGTLAPFTTERDRACPYPGVLPALEAVRRAGTRIAIVTGRPCMEVRTLAPLDPPIEIWGTHGHERLLPDGRRLTAGLSEGPRRALADLRAWLAAEGLEEYCENKSTSIAVHWRSLPEARTQAVHARLAVSPVPSDFRVLPFDGGIEFCAPGADKGDAVRTALDELGRGAAVAYLGDDVTDEDAFTAIAGHGLGILVRPAFRATAATAWLQPPDELLAFLHDWRAHVVAR